MNLMKIMHCMETQIHLWEFQDPIEKFQYPSEHEAESSCNDMGGKILSLPESASPPSSEPNRAPAGDLCSKGKKGAV